MPDRIEREIEDILNKLDDFVPEKGQQPIPFRPRQKKANNPSRGQGWAGQKLARISLNQVMLYALIAVLAAFFLRALPFASWVMIGALIVLATAFVMSMRQGGRGGSTRLGSGPAQKRWRGQPIDDSPPPGPSFFERLKGRFGKGRR